MQSKSQGNNKRPSTERDEAESLISDCPSAYIKYEPISVHDKGVIPPFRREITIRDEFGPVSRTFGGTCDLRGSVPQRISTSAHRTCSQLHGETIEGYYRIYKYEGVLNRQISYINIARLEECVVVQGGEALRV